jgi:hypothetical protein
MVRFALVAAAALLSPWVVGTCLVAPTPAAAEPTSCDDPTCVPGITFNVGLGAPCGDFTYFVFGTTDHNRIVFCGSPRRYGQRYFRSPPMVGIKNLGDNCYGFENDVAQAPDGMFLFCGRDESAPNGSQSRWIRGDI